LGDNKITLPLKLLFLFLFHTGTEEIVENLCPWEEVVEKDLPWCDSAVFRRTIYKPWLDENDAKEVLFSSVHGYGPTDTGSPGMFYPGTSATTTATTTTITTTATTTTATTTTYYHYYYYYYYYYCYYYFFYYYY